MPQHQPRSEALVLGTSWPGLTMHPEKPAVNMDKRNKRCSKFPSTASNVFAASVTRELTRPFAGCARKREICPQLWGVSCTKPRCGRTTFLTQASPWWTDQEMRRSSCLAVISSRYSYIHVFLEEDCDTALGKEGGITDSTCLKNAQPNPMQTTSICSNGLEM